MEQWSSEMLEGMSSLPCSRLLAPDVNHTLDPLSRFPELIGTRSFPLGAPVRPTILTRPEPQAHSASRHSGFCQTGGRRR